MDHNDSERKKSTNSLCVGIPTRNRPDMLKRCLDMLSKQSSMGFQLIIADSSGDDETKKVCKQYERFFDSFVYVKHNKYGTSAARNIIAKCCETHLLIYLDCDVYVDNDCIDQLVCYFEKLTNKEDCILAPSVKFPQGPSRPGKLSRDGVGFPADHQSTDYLISALILLPKKIYKNISWNERLAHNYDDIFYSLKCKRLGLRLAFYDAILAVHDEGYSTRPRYSEVQEAGSKVYTMLFKHIFVSPSLLSLLVLETYGFIRTLLWNLQPYIFHPALAVRLSISFADSWFKGHYWFLVDLKDLSATT